MNAKGRGSCFRGWLATQWINGGVRMYEEAL